MLTKKDIRTDYPGKLALTLAHLELAREAMSRLWNERLAERELGPNEDRSGSCKFAALLARDLFGGRLAGNYEHIFIQKDRKIIDLNADQMDVLFLGEMAHLNVRSVIEHPDYRASLANCQPRVSRWVDWVMMQPGISLSHVEENNSNEPTF